MLVPAPLEVTPSGLSEAALVMMADRAISECCAIPAGSPSRDAPNDQEVKMKRRKKHKGNLCNRIKLKAQMKKREMQQFTDRILSLVVE